MLITLNGQPVSVNEARSTVLQQYLTDQGLKLDRIAVECNGEIVPRTTWQQVRLAEGDRLEIVHFVGGGAATS